MSVNPLKTIQRRLEPNHEIVSISYTGGWFGQLRYLSSAKGKNDQYYKEFLCDDCGYPRDDWERIVSIKVTLVVLEKEEGITLEIKFKNVGKWLEHLIEKQLPFQEICINKDAEGNISIDGLSLTSEGK